MAVERQQPAAVRLDDFGGDLRLGLGFRRLSGESPQRAYQFVAFQRIRRQLVGPIGGEVHILFGDLAAIPFRELRLHADAAEQALHQLPAEAQADSVGGRGAVQQEAALLGSAQHISQRLARGH